MCVRDQFKVAFAYVRAVAGVRSRSVAVVPRRVLPPTQMRVTRAGARVEHWSFPLLNLNLRKRAVEQDELDEHFRRGESQSCYEMYGALE